MIERYLEQIIRNRVGDGKAIVIFGARQVGKTTLLRQLFLESEVLWLNGDEEEVRAAFDNLSAMSFATIIGNKKLLVIDEAQRIDNIGLKLKIIQDTYGDRVQIIATGSSSFDLANKVNEPLTGRKWEYRMFPVSFSEMVKYSGLINERSNLENRILYGYYPDIVLHPKDAKERLRSLASDNLYKDILRLEGIHKPNKLEKLLQALAFQIGSQVSINELSNTIGLDNKTTEKYLGLLEQSFVVFRLPSFARNLRHELSASSKYYFYDTGIRNALLDNFRPMALRQDVGHLFENFIISELQKTASPRKQYFWRTSQQQEVDYLSERDGEIFATEIKWSASKNPRLSKTFVDQYRPSTINYINRENYHEFLLHEQNF
jgi:predicted AAA+ superfamily ATPase